MTCSLCPYTVKKSLMKVNGVKSADIDIKTKAATILYDPNVTSPNALIQATSNAGYPTKLSR
jgi:mercuric ion binding protein